MNEINPVSKKSNRPATWAILVGSLLLSFFFY
jgi:hypothetical protein